jgi:hypothetical protein
MNSSRCFCVAVNRSLEGMPEPEYKGIGQILGIIEDPLFIFMDIPMKPTSYF